MQIFNNTSQNERDGDETHARINLYALGCFGLRQAERPVRPNDDLCFFWTNGMGIFEKERGIQ